MFSNIKVLLRIQNLTNAGSLISGINLGANGINRIIGKATHITGDTLIDRAVIKSGMIDKFKDIKL